MPDSIWTASLESLVEELASAKVAPAGVTAAAVGARLGIALLIKTLAIVGRRRNFMGDAAELAAWIGAARRQSVVLAEAAHEDIVAGAEQRRTVVPMKAARAAEAGLALCEEAAAVVTGSLAADLGVAKLLLQAGRDAIRLCVQSNQKESNRQARP